ncbi:isopentenyl-diphosphate Delta-isomerase [Clostridium mediterraneense]|uniref:isopentenyl-diphosphate Delta-isomerase n=1 Tax=Clostridium mediterraneense TaxID=1805472 RepID=UPI000835BB29|nr:isopentenyl-diphosphate Delta-isomerase [Clostridium mediterraneense]
MEYIAVVDTNDNIILYQEKIEVHEKGILHRAFSVLLFNDKNELLLQRRALEKYHSPGEWTNTCCSHQREGETLLDAANRRITEELGIKDVELKEEFTFHYKCKFSNELYENEIDHVYTGTYNGDISNFNRDEVCEVKWISYDKLVVWMENRPDEFTFWFKDIMKRIPKDFKFD